MANSDERTKTLRFRPGHYERRTSVEGESVKRVVQIANCVAFDNTELDLSDKFMTLYITESTTDAPDWKNRPGRIGALSLDSTWMNLYIPTAAFTEFWNAAAAKDETMRQIHFDIGAVVSGEGDRRIFAIVGAHLYEFMNPGATPEYDDAGKPKFVRQSRPPVIDQLHIMNQRLVQLSEIVGYRLWAVILLLATVMGILLWRR